MTREEAKAEINKEFEPAFANYIITALTDGATPSERKTGKWIVKGNKCVCSSCGSDDEYNLLEYRYCPYCGAKMEVDDDANDAK